MYMYKQKNSRAIVDSLGQLLLSEAPFTTWMAGMSLKYLTVQALPQNNLENGLTEILSCQ